MGLSLDVYTILWDFKESRKIGANGVSDRFEFGSLGDDGAVEIDDAEAGVVDASDGFAEEVGRVAAVVGGVVVGEQLADVALGDGAEQRVGDGVEEDVAVGMGDGSGGVFDGDAADDHWPPAVGGCGEAVKVVAVSDPITGLWLELIVHVRRSWRSARTGRHAVS